jgi:hypothetical protein
MIIEKASSVLTATINKLQRDGKRWDLLRMIRKKINCEKAKEVTA